MPPVSFHLMTSKPEVVWLISNVSLAWLNDAGAHGQF